MKTAVFYDLENIALANSPGGFEQVFTKLIKEIKKSALVGEIALQKAYISKTHSSLIYMRDVLQKHNVILVEVEPLLGVGRPKANMVDFKMNVDVIATITRMRSVKTVAIASGDKDFGFMCQQIKDMNKNLLIISRFETTCNAMLKLCDDWVDLNGRILSSNFIKKAIESRISTSYSETDPFQALQAFLSDLENDVLIRRYMTSFGLSLDTFVTLVQNKITALPHYASLGFKKLTNFVTILLNDTNFVVKANLVKYSKGKKPLSQIHLIENILNLPTNYTRERILKWYDFLAEVDNVEELLVYIDFMKRNGMLVNNNLCYRRNFKSTIRKHIRKKLENAGIKVNEDDLQRINSNL